MAAVSGAVSGLCGGELEEGEEDDGEDVAKHLDNLMCRDVISVALIWRGDVEEPNRCLNSPSDVWKMRG